MISMKLRIWKMFKTYGIYETLRSFFVTFYRVAKYGIDGAEEVVRQRGIEIENKLKRVRIKKDVLNWAVASLEVPIVKYKDKT